MSNDEILNLLTIVLIIMITIFCILSVIFIALKVKKDGKKVENVVKDKNKKNEEKTKIITPQNYTKHSIFDFMEFDKIDDNMIVQKDGKRYIMVINCQGINYDLMSGLEKNSVEQGFLQFLNTLRYPIQLYVQTRTVNLTKSINTYRQKTDEISREYVTKQMEYNQKLRSGQYDKQELEKERFELIRQRNLYEYGLDIVNNTERMSLNKNILSKYYYIVLSYYPEEAANSNFDKSELSSIAFSELYTKSQAIISSLAVCDVKGRILNSEELAELLYIAYNRDESEIFDLRKSLEAGYEDLYSTAPDVLDKKIKELDIKIEQEAIKKANETIFNVMEENQKAKAIKQKEEELDSLINQMATILIEENKRSVGEEVAEKAIEKINNEKIDQTEEKGGIDDEQKEETTSTIRNAD